MIHQEAYDYDSSTLIKTKERKEKETIQENMDHNSGKCVRNLSM